MWHVLAAQVPWIQNIESHFIGNSLCSGFIVCLFFATLYQKFLILDRILLSLAVYLPQMEWKFYGDLCLLFSLGGPKHLE